MIAFYASINGTGNGLTPATPASITAAKTLVRGASGSDDITVYLLPGTYRLADTLEFTSLDSGTNGHSVEWKNYSTTPVLSGGRVITGWTLHDAARNIWKAPTLAGIKSRQFYINGRRAVRCRRASYSFVVDEGEGVYPYCTYEVLPNFAKPTDLEFVIRVAPWEYHRIHVESIEYGELSKFVLAVDAYEAWQAARGGISPISAPPVFIENAYEFLDPASPGQWYLDTTANIIYYIPLPGENMLAVEAVLPVLECLISSPFADPVSNVTFYGIDLADSGWITPTIERCFLQVQSNFYLTEASGFTWDSIWGMPRAAVELCGADNVTFLSCLFQRMGGMAAHLGRGAKNCNLVFNEFTDISASAIVVGEADYTNRSPAFVDRCSNNRITGNNIHNVAFEYAGGVGICATFVDQLRILRNEISNMPYTGISLGWGWDAPGFEAGYANNNEIGWNKIHDVMTQLGDGAAIYTLGTLGGPVTAVTPPDNPDCSTIHDNYIYNVGVPGSDDARYIYPDQGSHYLLITNNVMYSSRTTDWLSLNKSVANGNGYIVATGNYVTGNINTIWNNANCSLAYIANPTIITGSSPSGWPAPAQSIVANAGTIINGNFIFPSVPIPPSILTPLLQGVRNGKFSFLPMSVRPQISVPWLITTTPESINGFLSLPSSNIPLVIVSPSIVGTILSINAIRAPDGRPLDIRHIDGTIYNFKHI